MDASSFDEETVLQLKDLLQATQEIHPVAAEQTQRRGASSVLSLDDLLIAAMGANRYARDRDAHQAASSSNDDNRGAGADINGVD